MGLISQLLSFTRARVDDAHVSDAKIDPGGGANVTAHHFGPPGDDSVPLPGDFVATSPSTGTGTEQVTGYIDPANEPQAEAGEKRLYSRDGDGAVVAVVWLKNDGSIVIDNGTGAIELEPGGNVTINGVTIDTDGNVSAPGEVSAMSSAPATRVGLSTHLHPTAMGPSDAPTPGT